MFNFTQSARSVQTPLVLTAPEPVVRAQHFDMHVLAREWYFDDLDREVALAEADRLQADWDALSPIHRDELVDSYVERWNSNSPLTGEFRFDSFCHSIMIRQRH